VGRFWDVVVLDELVALPLAVADALEFDEAVELGETTICWVVVKTKVLVAVLPWVTKAEREVEVMTVRVAF
jgi:hypothetical protein